MNELPYRDWVAFTKTSSAPGWSMFIFRAENFGDPADLEDDQDREALIAHLVNEAHVNNGIRLDAPGYSILLFPADQALQAQTVHIPTLRAVRSPLVPRNTKLK